MLTLNVESTPAPDDAARVNVAEVDAPVPIKTFISNLFFYKTNVDDRLNTLAITILQLLGTEFPFMLFMDFQSSYCLLGACKSCTATKSCKTTGI